MELVERDGELAALWASFRAVRVDAGRVAVLAGEAGVGKAVLARRYADEIYGVGVST